LRTTEFLDELGFRNAVARVASVTSEYFLTTTVSNKFVYQTSQCKCEGAEHCSKPAREASYKTGFRRDTVVTSGLPPFLWIITVHYCGLP
jgi:hypothetical protein